ncbi:hypothetical protein [Streptomyces botrytidirepellens]|uniref:hypothetical protein n=1 Tax=Streptomyces botrytidirepellens TaxID=2486417 RepID=UPI00160E22DC
MPETVPTRRPQMLVDEFEELARTAPETVWLECINGKLEMKPAQDGNRGEIVMWLVRLFLEQRPDLSLYPYRGLKAEARPGQGPRCPRYALSSSWSSTAATPARSDISWVLDSISSGCRRPGNWRRPTWPAR